VKGKRERKEGEVVRETENGTPLYIGRGIKDFLHLHNQIQFVVTPSEQNLICCCTFKTEVDIFFSNVL